MSGDAEDPIARSDLQTRFVMGVVMAAVACLAIYVGGWLFRLLVAAGAGLMLVEWGDMHRVGRRSSIAAAVLLALALLALTGWYYPPGEMDIDPLSGLPAIAPESFDMFVRLFLVLAGAAVVSGIVCRRVTMAGGFLYIALPALALLLLEWAWFALVFWAMLVTWATDIFAYAAGRTIGGPKLAPRISPNKTWAGLGGGVLGAAAVGWLIASWFDLGSPFTWIGGAMGLLAQAGDLYESWLKRRAGVKDSGTILPGHGGALDRLDGLLPVAIASLLILMAGLWTG
ncbi:MAG TPA: phosphatidate cytidylyltransferase [Allosphingosinicella sp.]|jgi:phosphatidate cytidylyltransferase|uniref:phosphatidate cytidylyltransferase n=1 Tax=Allosphingosinicella sp. TaxID=2823234 RepID=UPI002F299776